MSKFLGCLGAAQSMAAISSRSGIAGGRQNVPPPHTVDPRLAALQAGLTREQRDQIPSFARHWVHTPWRAGALTAGQWADWEAGARKCYEARQVAWPAVVVRTPSPLVGGLALTVAARVRNRPSSAVIDAVVSSTLGGLSTPTVSAPAVSTALRDAVRRILDAGGGAETCPAFDGPHMPEEVFVDIPTLAKRAYRPVAGRVLAPVLSSGHRFDVAVSAAVRGRVASAWAQPLGERALHARLAFAAFFRDIVEYPAGEQVWEYLRAVESAWSASYWWALQNCVVVCDRPTSVRRDDGVISLSWADGWTCTVRGP